MWGLYGGLAFSDRESVWLRDWSDPRQAREIPTDLLPEELYPNPVLSPDGRYLALPAAECVRLVDLSRGTVVEELCQFGDWAVVPRFAPDSRTIAVGNSMQGTWWLTMLEITDGTLRVRYTRENDLPTTHAPEVVTDLAFSPDGSLLATLVRPDGGGEPLVVTTVTDTGETVWAHRGEASALCFSGDRLAVAQATGVLWLAAATGTTVGEDGSIGRVNALAARDTIVVAATDHGLRYVHS
jgi:WD40 repeat protein